MNAGNRQKKYVWSFWENGLKISKKTFFAHYDYAENIYNELKNTDAECIWTDGCFDIFKDYQ